MNTLHLAMRTVPLAVALWACTSPTTAATAPPDASAVLLNAPASGFDFGGDCSEGSGSFNQDLAQNATIGIGEIPSGKTDVRVQLTAVSDLDIQLIDKASGTVIVGWPNGVLHGPNEECTRYRGARYCYSGYNGGQTPNTLGEEWVRIEGDTKRDLEMLVYAYQPGTASVHYTWKAAPDCADESGSGSFAAYIARQDMTEIGDIPAGIENVHIELKTRGGRDVDVQLFDGDTPIIEWPNGVLSGPSEDTATYNGIDVTYSGYNGIDGNWGHEFIDIQGVLPSTLTMRAYGYQSGFADIWYTWGPGPGQQAPAIRFPQVFDDVILNRCSACHAGGLPFDGLDLSTVDRAYTALVAKPAKSDACGGRDLVTPGDPIQSVLYQKVSGVRLCGPLMPPSGMPLPDDEVDLIRQWIADGALR